MTDHVTALYVHIPFCEHKCDYCDFASVAGTAQDATYTGRLIEELTTLGATAQDDTINTVFVGGGTPGLLDLDLLASIVNTMRTRFHIAADAEVTIEANPSSLSAARAQRWLELGFNRISIGVQSLDDDCLRFLGRVHDSARARAAIADARRAGFTNLSCDLIYAIPGMLDATWQRTLEGVAAMAPDHVSAYELTFEPGTALHRRRERGGVASVSDDVAIRQHWMAVDTFASAGLDQYEVSNFSRPGFACRHNVNYWRNGYYLAAGLGAHGHIPVTRLRSNDRYESVEPIGHTVTSSDDLGDAVAIRYWNTRGLSRYIAGDIREGDEIVTTRQHREETLMVGLRLNDGIDVGDDIVARARALQDAGLVSIRERHVTLTRRGQEVLNEVVTRLAA